MSPHQRTLIIYGISWEQHPYISHLRGLSWQPFGRYGKVCPASKLWKRKQATLNQEFGDPDIIYMVELKVCCDSSPEQTFLARLRPACQPYICYLQAAPDRRHPHCGHFSGSVRHCIRRLHSRSASQARHQWQTSEANSPEAGNLRQATHAKDLGTQTETPAAGRICSNHASRHQVAPYLYILMD